MWYSKKSRIDFLRGVLATYEWPFRNIEHPIFLSVPRIIRVPYYWLEMKASILFSKLMYPLSCFHCVKCVQIRSFFWSLFSRIRIEYEEIRSISPYSVRMRENRDQKKLRIWTLFTQCSVCRVLWKTYIYVLKKQEKSWLFGSSNRIYSRTRIWFCLRIHWRLNFW